MENVYELDGLYLCKIGEAKRCKAYFGAVYKIETKGYVICRYNPDLEKPFVNIFTKNAYGKLTQESNTIKKGDLCLQEAKKLRIKGKKVATEKELKALIASENAKLKIKKSELIK